MKLLLAFAAILTLGFNVALHAEDDTPLGKEMSAMNKSLRALKKQLPDAAKKDDNLALIGKIKVNLVEFLKYEPATTKNVAPADKAAFLAKYKEQIDATGKSFDELEAAIKADKTDEAKKVLEKLSEQKEKGHKDFAPDDK
jgi:hypothetical protein